jgi:hypothetical protein
MKLQCLFFTKIKFKLVIIDNVIFFGLSKWTWLVTWLKKFDFTIMLVKGTWFCCDIHRQILTGPKNLYSHC